MSDKLRLDIVTPYGLIFSDEVLEISATGAEGDFGVLPGHVHFAATLKVGVLTARTESGPKYFFVNGGYAEVGPEKVTVLADSAEKSEEIDVERAKTAMARAEERLRKTEEIDFVRAQASLERALMRIQVADRKLQPR